MSLDSSNVNIRNVLTNYIKKHPHKPRFYINNLVKELNIPEPIVAKELEILTNNDPSVGTFDRETGWFNRPSEENKISIWSFIIIIMTLFYIPSSIIIFPIIFNINFLLGIIYLCIGIMLFIISAIKINQNRNYFANYSVYLSKIMLIGKK